MTDLVTWLRAQLDREEGDANLIPGGGYQPARWTAHRVPDGDWAEIRQHDLPVGADADEGEEISTAGLMTWGRNEDLHVARWDPARVVAEVAAKRAILDLHAIVSNGCDKPDSDYCQECYYDRGYNPQGFPMPCPTVRLLALPYASNPGYEESWRPR